MRATAFCLATLLLIVGTDALCPVGLYGPTCKLTCGSHCTASKCEPDPDRGTFRCSEECTDGWTGPTCNQKCTRRCMSCDQTTGACAKCMSDWCGENCDQLCSKSGAGVPPNCLDANCTYCHDGWYGHNCGSACPSNCESGCDRTSGLCDHQCVQGYHGVLCNKPCTTTCLDGCRQSDGSCIGGCQSGWHSSHCNVSCNNTCIDNTCYQESGTCIRTGHNSQVPVPPRCRPVWRDNEKVRSCDAGCEDGWRGDRCDQRCPEKCHSCSRHPDPQLCIYTREVVKTRKHGVGGELSMSFQLRLVYALLLVLFPVLIVGIVQLLRVCYEKYKRRRGKKTYDVNQPLTSL